MTLPDNRKPAAPVAGLARPDGTFAMVAMDQRDSLRTMLAERTGRTRDLVADAEMTAFKLAVAHELGPYASALLIDRHYGFRRMLDEDILPGTCAPILAADALDQQPGGAVEDTALDEDTDAAAAARAGVRALKLLLIWRRDARREQRVSMAARFIRICRDAGLASVLEPVARPTPGEEAGGAFRLDDAIVEAARELGPLRPSLYKCQVPGGGKGTVAQTAREAARIDAELDIPWVVLSQGVAPADFPRAVEAACRAGASGFLAGRALWSDVLGAADTRSALREAGAPRLRRLSETVRQYGRPWWSAAAHRGAAAEGGAT